MGLSQFDERKAQQYNGEIDNSNGTASVVAAPGLQFDYHLDMLFLVNTDSSSRILNLYLTIGATTEPFASVLVPARAGFDGNPPVEAMSEVLPSSQTGMVVQGGATLDLAVTVTVTSGQAIGYTLIGGLL